MSWDPVWEKIFSERDWGRYPPEELIRFVARRFFGAADRSDVRILELGCGTGANIWFLAREGLSAVGLDGSQSAIDKARARMADEGLHAELDVADIVEIGERYPAEHFDAVIDVACLQCNRLGAVRSIVDQAASILKPGGAMFSMMIAAGSYGDGTGTELEPGTYEGVEVGPAAGTGNAHFFTIEEVEDLFDDFDAEIEATSRSLEGRQQWYQHWVVEATKRVDGASPSA